MSTIMTFVRATRDLVNVLHTIFCYTYFSVLTSGHPVVMVMSPLLCNLIQPSHRLPTRCDEMRCLLLAPGWRDAMTWCCECYTALYRLPTYLDQRLCNLDNLRCARVSQVSQLFGDKTCPRANSVSPASFELSSSERERREEEGRESCVECVE